MIVELTVENLAIIERSQLTLGPGFTVLTGETGAGKSLLIDAIELALGERADTELVRTGASSATVDVVLNLTSDDKALEKCHELGLVVEDGVLFIRREVYAEGRSQCRIGGKLTPVGTLRQLGEYLVDLHGQHDHQSLMDPERHIVFLDAWIGRPAEELLLKLGLLHQEAVTARSRLASQKSGRREREQRLDLLRFQVSDIEEVSPLAGEMIELEGQLSRLKNVEKLSNVALGTLQSVSEQEDCAIDVLGTAVKGMEDASHFDPALEALLQPFREALYQLEEGSHALRAYAEELESDPALLEEVAGRIDSLKKLRRKYGDDEASILEFLLQAKAELALLEGTEGSEEELAAAVLAAVAGLEKAADDLSWLRKERALEFAGLVQTQLRDLAMERALFKVDFKNKPADEKGWDVVQFFFSANAGEDLRPLSKIASGGEISRVMLAIKTALAGRAGVPTLIFDEVEAGLGGRAAATVARKLEELAAHYQIIVISHLPQIASRATTHYRIEKVEAQGRVNTQVRLLSEAERVEEIARMLAGEQVTTTALANAREMLAR